MFICRRFTVMSIAGPLFLVQVLAVLQILTRYLKPRGLLSVDIRRSHSPVRQRHMTSVQDDEDLYEEQQEPTSLERRRRGGRGLSSNKRAAPQAHHMDDTNGDWTLRTCICFPLRDQYPLPRGAKPRMTTLWSPSPLDAPL